MKFPKSRSRRIGTAALALIVSSGAFLIDGPSGNAAVRTGPARTMIVMLRNQNSSLAYHSATRRAAVKSEQAPILKSLRASGATHITSLSVLNAVIAKMSPAEAATLAAKPSVANVLKNSLIPAATPTAKAPVAPTSKSANAVTSKVPNSLLCGTASNPQLNPEALTNISATPTQLGSNDGAGVRVATIADGLDPTDPDFQRNAAYGQAGQPVVKLYNFDGDPAGTPTPGEEMFGDASSIASQGNAVYDLSTYVSSAHPLPHGCDIKIVGDAPGASVDALNTFPNSNDETESAFLQAINFAVANGDQVVNESFGGNPFPDTSLDVTRDANDAAVAAGVTVVASTGDAGITSTIGSPATDPNIISVGASTTFRSYLQFTDGGINAPGASGAYIDNNISALSSGGYSQSGNTVDLVAPGDLNWALCGVNATLFTDCTNESGNGTPFDLFGGTSEASPLTAGAAADVISAYASSHHGQDPSPALVKEILMSTATDIGSPADEQGAGLLNVLAAVKDARSIQSGYGFGNNSNNAGGGLLLNPGQINVVQGPGQASNQSVQVTNTGNSPVSVNLSTRALASSPIASQTSTFCMQPSPSAATSACPANTGVFPIWSGFSEVYQEVNFNVPHTGQALSRLEFSADYQDTGQTSLLHFALLDPTGAYAAYSLPQGQADYGEVEVTNPMAGKWTAVFFTVDNDLNPGNAGTSGPVQWSANTYLYGQGGNVFPSTLNIGPGQTASAHLSVTSSNAAGDSDQSVVVSSPYGTTTVPVTIRTTIQTDRHGGTFQGVLTGGNGRAFGGVAQTNTYQFNVPGGLNDLDVGVALANDPGDFYFAELVDPNGQTVSYTSNVTATDGSDQTPAFGLTTNLYKVNPIPGQWSLVVEWTNPVTGNELVEPFTGTVQFNGVNVSSNLPNGGFARIASGSTQTYNVHVTNTGNAPEAYFVDPRLNQNVTISLPNQNGNVDATDMTLPLPGGGLTWPEYFVPSQTTQLQASITGSAPVTFDVSYYPGDPDISPGLNSRFSTYGGIHGDSASVTLNEPEVSPGMWLLNPAEIGPFGASGAPAVTASSNLNVVTQAFDPSVSSSTGDMWTIYNGLSNATFAPVYLAPGASTTITVSVTASGSPGSHVSGTLFVDDYALGTPFFGLYTSDELAAIPYSYTVGH